MRAAAVTPAARCGRPDHDQRMGARELRGERRPQRTSRDHPAIADGAPGVDDEHRKVLGERGILEAVIHDDDARAGSDCHAGAADAIARHDGRRDARQQKRLVAHLAGAVPSRVDLSSGPASVPP